MTAEPSPLVTIAVLTYQRPADLREALPTLVGQAESVNPPAEVLVIDNDPEGSARDSVSTYPSERVRYVHEPTPGIAAARNRAMVECSRDLLVFIDDDERPTEGWLNLLTEKYLEDRPAGVVGPVVSRYEEELDPWIGAGRFFERLRHPTGTQLAAAATNNLLLDLAQVMAMGVTFDERLGLSGGSDNLFTRELVRRGGRLIWCDEAAVIDVVPASRLTRSWVLRRAFRTGNTEARVSVELAQGPAERFRARARETGRGLLRLTGGSVRWLNGALTGSVGQRARGRRTLARGMGIVAGGYGLIYSEYRRPQKVSVEARYAAQGQ